MNTKLISWIKEYVNTILGGLDNLYYHHYEHTLEVLERTQELWKKEALDDSNLELLAVASLFHDTWFIVQYDENEFIWASIAKKYLMSIKYDNYRITQIEQLILATSMNHTATNLLEKIIKDADTDNLWRDDFFEKWNRLKKELEAIKKIKILEPDWVHHSIALLKQHKFLSPIEIKERQKKKEENLKKLEEILRDLKD